MVELIVDCRGGGSLGDVLAAKPLGSVWGDQEYRMFLIVRRSDPQLEQAVLDAGGVLSYPYATYDVKGRITLISSWRLNAASLNIPMLSDQTVPIMPVDAPEAAWYRYSRVQPATDAPEAEAPGLLARGWNWATSWL